MLFTQKADDETENSEKTDNAIPAGLKTVIQRQKYSLFTYFIPLSEGRANIAKQIQKL